MPEPEARKRQADEAFQRVWEPGTNFRAPGVDAAAWHRVCTGGAPFMHLDASPRGCPRPRSTLGVLIPTLGLVACGSEAGVGAWQASLAVDGPWAIPAHVLARGDAQEVAYTGAGPWVGESGCGGGLLEGSSILRDRLFQWFPQAYAIGGYDCRPIVGSSSSMSLHATGRALDVMIATVDGDADNEHGDPVGNWLIEHAEEIGIQMIIWDRWVWRADGDPGDKEGPYSGQHPHDDHLHLELTPEAAALETPFFQGDGAASAPVCGVVPLAGAVVDDADDCADRFGPDEYWRTVEGQGFQDSLHWTNAMEARDPSNWGRWSLAFEAAGRYRVDIYADPAYALAPRVRYEIKHAEDTSALLVDQEATDGWTPLGAFDFAAGAAQHVTLFDNTDAPVPDERHIVFDALRLTPCAGDDCPDLGGTPTDPTAPAPDDGPALEGGCTAGGRPLGAPDRTPAVLLFALALLARRRRSTRALPINDVVVD